MAGIAVKDTDGDKWMVYPGDPAHRAVKQLQGMEWEPRLPASFLATGRVFPEAVQSALETLEALDDGDDDVLLEVHDTYRQLRYLDGTA